MKKLRIALVPLTIVAVAAIAVILAFGGHVTSASAAAGGTEVFHGKFLKPRTAKAAAPAVTSSNMTYHGGPVCLVPTVYISWWGSQWNNGWLYQRAGSDLYHWLLRQCRRQFLAQY